MQTGTPPKITNAIKKLCKTICPTSVPVFVPVVPEVFSKEQECFDNVRIKAGRDGGVVQLGWAIWLWPRVLVEGEFHAVWRTMDNILIDVTPNPRSRDVILFLPDEAREYNFVNREPRLDNYRRALSDHPAVHQYIDIVSRMFQIARERGDQYYGELADPEYIGLLGKRALLERRLERF